MRASDADREYIAEQLRDAAAEGRLLAEELEHRLEAVFAARTYGELNSVVSDLPRERGAGRATRRIPVRLRPATAVALVLALPIALAIAAAAIVAVVALLVAWSTTVSLLALFLGSRARALPRPWAIGYLVSRRRRSLTPWQ
jgi:hypothetical protein